MMVGMAEPSITVVITDGNLRHVRDELEQAMPPGADLRWLVGAEDSTLHEALAEADVLVGARFTPEMAAAAPQLKLVQVAGAGIDGIDQSALPDGVRLANAYRHEDAMAEHAVWAAIGLRRGFVEGDHLLRDNVWASPAADPQRPMPRGLKGAHVGFFGFGHIGERAWRAFRSFGARGAAVTGRGSIDPANHGLDWTGGPSELGRLCEESDVLLVCAPLNDATRGVIAVAELRALGPDGVLINQARGPVVDEDALYETLRDGSLGAAAIDVWYSYPGDPADTAPSTHSFGELPNALLTPHVSGVAMSTFEGRAADIGSNVTALVNGDPLINLVR